MKRLTLNSILKLRNTILDCENILYKGKLNNNKTKFEDYIYRYYKY